MPLGNKKKCIPIGFEPRPSSIDPESCVTNPGKSAEFRSISPRVLVIRQSDKRSLQSESDSESSDNTSPDNIDFRRKDYNEFQPDLYNLDNADADVSDLFDVVDVAEEL
ncbi:hypothetical protein PV326_006208 [Microctonus aethiopoides]|uniref:Uncharacterized protein n=1 Tax=Microctonus aethiopoides TaxID=144406 RepID=A0AA39KX32_9HYME|nr:hypothetical protein PV326_006208 [Microctonus aethiopoides]KAK0177143.1 hypothetical protein PV328_001222 [Microctonus aethiopoides]